MADDESQQTSTQDHAVDSPAPSAPETRRSSTSGPDTAGAGSSSLDTSRRRARPEHPVNYGSMQSSIQSITGRPPVASPSATARTPKRPGTVKRTTSQGPHRGQEFSVDDAREEVDEDTKLAKTVSGHSLRRQASTLRRRPTAQAPSLPRVESDEREEEEAHASPTRPAAEIETHAAHSDDTDATLQAEEEEEEEADDVDEDDADLSDAESFTLKDRQEAINETHPFGIRIWKPALYKKNRSVQKNAEGDIHSTPGGNVSSWLILFNFMWTLLFGWWMALISLVGALLCHLLRFAPGCAEYGSVLMEFSGYIFYPFGKFVKLEHDEAYLEEDEGEGRSISEYERWQTGDLEEGRLFFGPTDISRSLIGRRRESVASMDETDSLLGRTGRGRSATQRSTKKRLFGRGKWTLGRVIYFFFFWGLITPSLFIVSALCWFMVFTIPMGKVTLLLFYHLRRHPLALAFHSDSHYSRGPGSPSSSVLLCTYRAVGIKYWKYTIDGTNIFLINLLGLVLFAILDFYVLRGALDIHNPITSSGFIFAMALFSIIPLAYFIGQAVASISAQSSMGVGATINALFSTIVEVFLYCVALNEGKAQLVEGSIIGSIFAGILLLPGISMCFGAIKRKTQRFNVRSAGVTSTMLLFAVIGSFGPTLFYQINGSHELVCHQCIEVDPSSTDRDCRRCYFNQTPAVHDRFFIEAVRPYIWFAATLLFLSYVIGLLFTLRTHAAVIWNNELDEKKLEKMEQQALNLTSEHRPGSLTDPHASMTRQNTAGTLGTLPRENIKDSQLYKRILGQSLKQAGIHNPSESGSHNHSHSHSNSHDKRNNSSSLTSPVNAPSNLPHLVPPKSADDDDRRSVKSVRISGLSPEDNRILARQVAEMAATAATVAARDATRAPRKASQMATTSGNARPHTSTSHSAERPTPQRTTTFGDELEDVATPAANTEGHASGGHDAPNWSRTKSAVILLTATVAYAVIAEILVDTVDSVLEHVDIDEKFLGITLFALVPNTTEFLNAISFAMNGNIALSMEIGSAYALQVMLLQVPALVLYSGVKGRYIDPNDIVDHIFTLIFPQWDMVTVILGVFLLSYVVGEGKSNYFKGSILVLSYLVIIVGFYVSGYDGLDLQSLKGVNRFDTLATNGAFESFGTIGRSKSGRAY